MKRLSGGCVDAIIANAGGGPPETSLSLNFFGAVATLEGLRSLLESSAAPRAVAVSSIASLRPPHLPLVEACLSMDERAAIAVARSMFAEGGPIRTGANPLPDNLQAPLDLYGNAKYALQRWCRKAAGKPQWAGAGIPLNVVALGFFDTPAAAYVLSDADSRAAIGRMVPMHGAYPGRPEEAAAILAWCASPENSQMTGQILFVDGGFECLARGDIPNEVESPTRIGREVVVNFALPYLIYSVAQPRLGDVNALIASSGPPILWSVVEFARNRRIDALSMIVLLGLGLSLVAVLGGGSVRFLQLREKLVTVFIGVVFLGSAAIGRPLMYELVRASLARANDPELRRVESLRNNSGFRAGMTIMTVVWGVGLLADAAVSIALVYVLSIRTYLVVNPIMGYATIGSLIVWNFWFGRRMRRKGEARLAAAQAQSHPAAPSDAFGSTQPPGPGRPG